MTNYLTLQSDDNKFKKHMTLILSILKKIIDFETSSSSSDELKIKICNNYDTKILEKYNKGIKKINDDIKNGKLKKEQIEKLRQDWNIKFEIINQIKRDIHLPGGEACVKMLNIEDITSTSTSTSTSTLTSTSNSTSTSTSTSNSIETVQFNLGEASGFLNNYPLLNDFNLSDNKLNNLGNSIRFDTNGFIYYGPNGQTVLPSSVFDQLPNVVRQNLEKIKFRSALMPGQISEDQLKKDVTKFVDKIFDNNEFNEKVEKIKELLGDFISETCLKDNSQLPESFERQLINIKVFLQALYSFEETLRKGKNYKSVKKENIQDIKSKEVGNVQDEKNVKELNIKSSNTLSKLLLDKDFKLFSEISLRHDNPLVQKLITSQNIIDGVVQNQTFAGGIFPNTLSNSGSYTVDYNNPSTPALQSINTNFPSAKIPIYNRFLDTLLTNTNDFLKLIDSDKGNPLDISANAFYMHFTSDDSPLEDTLIFSTTNKPARDRAYILINILRSKKINLKKLPFLAYLRQQTKQGTDIPSFSRVLIESRNKINSGVLDNAAVLDFSNKKHKLYDPYFRDLFVGYELDSGVIAPRFKSDGTYEDLNVY